MKEVDVRTPRPEYNAQKDAWSICRDFFDGELAVKKAGTKYLPHLSRDYDSNEYEDYKSRALFFPLFRRSVETLAGIASRKPPAVTGDVPPSLAAGLENLTYDGDTLHMFVRDLIAEILTSGRAAIRVDTKDGRIVWSIIKAEGVTWWLDGGCVVKLDVPRSMGGFGVEFVKCWMHYHADGSSIDQWEETDKGDVEITATYKLGTATARRAPLGEPPIIPLTTHGLMWEPPVPPLLGLAGLNKIHYIRSADQGRGLHWTAMATPYVAGLKNPTGLKVTIGPDQMLTLPEGASMGMLEASGSGLGHTAASLIEVKREAEALGARLVSSDSASQQTATAVRMQSAATTASLTSIVGAVQTACQRAAEIHAKLAGEDIGDTQITLSRDFVAEKLTPPDIQALVTLFHEGVISLETLGRRLEAGDVLQPGEVMSDLEARDVDVPRETPTDANDIPVGAEGSGRQEGEV